MVKVVKLLEFTIFEVLIVNKFKDVFLVKLPRSPPKRVIEFCIDLVLDTHHFNTFIFCGTHKFKRVERSG